MRTTKNLKQKTVRFVANFLFIYLAFPVVANATTLEGILNKATNFLQGGIARAFGVLALVACGYMCIWLQKFPKHYLAMTLLGEGIIFGASYIYNYVVG